MASPRKRLALAMAAAGALLASAIAGCSAQAEPGASANQHGRVLERSFHSPAIAGTEHYAVYLPAGYASSRGRYPVIYALHGLPSDATGYRDMGIADWGRDTERAGRPAIVVSPQGARRGDSDPEWHDWGPGRDWETMVARDLVGQIDRSLRTIRGRRGRALIGVSAGGYGATIIGVHHPDVFSVIESWSGYFHPTNPAGDAPLDLGAPEANSAASVHTYVEEAQRIAARYGPTFLGFFVGDADPRFLPENQQLHRELAAAGVPHVFAVYQGAHTGSFWAAHEAEWIAAAVGYLTPAVGLRATDG